MSVCRDLGRAASCRAVRKPSPAVELQQGDALVDLALATRRASCPPRGRACGRARRGARGRAPPPSTECGRARGPASRPSREGVLRGGDGGLRVLLAPDAGSGRRCRRVLAGLELGAYVAGRGRDPLAADEVAVALRLGLECRCGRHDGALTPLRRCDQRPNRRRPPARRTPRRPSRRRRRRVGAPHHVQHRLLAHARGVAGDLVHHDVAFLLTARGLLRRRVLADRDVEALGASARAQYRASCVRAMSWRKGPTRCPGP